MTEVKKTASLLMIAADQSPSKVEPKEWLSFLNQETPFHPGFEKLVLKLNAPLVFLEMRKTARSHYEIIPTLITEDPSHTKPREILEKYVSLLEKSIVNHPAHWLWSHRRWKHAKND